MLDEDVPVWEAWLARYGDPAATYSYDVKVGKGITPDPNISTALQELGIGLTKKRIDVVESGPFHTRIIEVKRLAGLSSIAQLVGYPILYMATFNPSITPTPCLIAERLLLDVEMMLKTLQIEYYVIPPADQLSSEAVQARSFAEQGNITQIPGEI
jgi:hypothetical protein